MPTEMIPELREFHRFLGEKLAVAETKLSPEEALDEWRNLHPPTSGFDEDVAAIQEALDDLANGDRGIPFDQFDREFWGRRSQTGVWERGQGF